MTHHTEAELLHALEESQSLFAAMLHEPRPTSEIQKQMEQNRAAIDAARRAPESQSRVPMLFNPFNGRPRHPLDVQSDPYGLLITIPNTELRAAPITQEKQG